MPDAVSLNGPDNVGKTTQLRRLAEHWSGFQPLGVVHEHDPEPWVRAAYATWWFETSTTLELTEMLLADHAKRAAAREAGRIRHRRRSEHPESGRCSPRRSLTVGVRVLQACCGGGRQPWGAVPESGHRIACPGA